MIFLPKNCAALAALCGEDGGHYALGHVRVVEYQDGFYRCEASDGRVVAVARGPSAAPAGPVYGAEPEDPHHEGLVTAENWKSVFRVAAAGAGKGRAGAAPPGLAVRIGLRDVAFASADGVARANNDREKVRFPDVDRVLPRVPALCRVKVSPRLLGDLLRAAAAFTDDGVNAVELLFFPAKGGPLLGVMAKTAAGQTFDGLVVGMS